MYENNIETSGWGQAPILEKSQAQSEQCGGSCFRDIIGVEIIILVRGIGDYYISAKCKVVVGHRNDIGKVFGFSINDNKAFLSNDDNKKGKKKEL